VTRTAVVKYVAEKLLGQTYVTPQEAWRVDRFLKACEQVSMSHIDIRFIASVALEAAEIRRILGFEKSN
jgi:hypothetical protein